MKDCHSSEIILLKIILRIKNKESSSLSQYLWRDDVLIILTGIALRHDLVDVDNNRTSHADNAIVKAILRSQYVLILTYHFLQNLTYFFVEDDLENI